MKKYKILRYFSIKSVEYQSIKRQDIRTSRISRCTFLLFLRLLHTPPHGCSWGQNRPPPLPPPPEILSMCSFVILNIFFSFKPMLCNEINLKPKLNVSKNLHPTDTCNHKYKKFVFSFLIDLFI